MLFSFPGWSDSVFPVPPPIGMANHILVTNRTATGEEHVHHMPYHAEYFKFRNPSEAPLRRLTVDLIKTYRRINEAGYCICAVCLAVQEAVVRRVGICVTMAALL